MSFVHLHVHSPYSFLDGAGRIADLVVAAAEQGMPALALTDHDSLGGAVQFVRACRAAGIKPLLGAEVTLEGGHHLTLLARGPEGYRNLCRLLSRAHLNNPRGRPAASLGDLAFFGEDLIALSGCRRGEIPSLVLRRRFREARDAALKYLKIFGPDRFFLELQNTMRPGDLALNRYLYQLAGHLKIKTVATNNVHYVRREDFRIHDLLTCVRHGIALEDPHPGRPLNAENYLKSAQEMALLFKAYPEALRQTLALAETCRPALEPQSCWRPTYPVPAGTTAAALLRHLTFEGAAARYGRVGPELVARLEHELEVITRLGYEDYFLIAWDLVRYARERGIACAGRGSAADSAVAYCLGLTEVDAFARGLLFERFLSLERAEKPDIDIDFDARYRDEVAAYVCRRYGEERVAAVATYATYRARSAVRDLGKAMGFKPGELDRLAKRLPYHLCADEIEGALDFFPELKDPAFRTPRYRELYRYCAAVAGLPRHPGTHLGGLIVAGVPLAQIVPLQRAAKGVVVAQWDKHDVEELGLFKCDLLSLRILSALEDTVAAVRQSQPAFDPAAIPEDDAATFELLHRGETVGVFQLESPAQRALQVRLEAQNMEDLVASVALIRPGPIKGNMVEPFINRRLGREPVVYLHPRLRPILEKTYGLILFQEQAIAVATEVAGLTPGEADRLRRAMSRSRSRREMEAIGREFVARAVANGLDEATARAIFAAIEGYASYGFCEAHAAAFAVTAYRTAYLARHHPAPYFAALLSHQPMGYYAAHTLVTVARNRGVGILPPDVNKSAAAFTVEGGAIRTGLTRVRGLSRRTLQALLRAREEGDFADLADFCRRVPAAEDEVTNLILAGAFDGLHPNRRATLWAFRAARKERAVSARGGHPHGSLTSAPGFPPDGVPDFSPAQKIYLEWRVLGFATGPHPMAPWRPVLARRGYLTARELAAVPHGQRVKVAGLPVAPHRPPTRSGRVVVFLSLEDETGLADVTVFEDRYHRYGALIFTDRPVPLAVHGTVQREGCGAGLVAEKILPFPVETG